MKLPRFQRMKPGEYAEHRGRETSIWARESIAVYTAAVAAGELPAMSEDLAEWKREKRRWMDPINGGSQGYIIAWILKLGGYLD